jgi:hypothetical protein
MLDQERRIMNRISFLFIAFVATHGAIFADDIANNYLSIFLKSGNNIGIVSLDRDYNNVFCAWIENGTWRHSGFTSKNRISLSTYSIGIELSPIRINIIDEASSGKSIYINSKNKVINIDYVLKQRSCGFKFNNGNDSEEVAFIITPNRIAWDEIIDSLKEEINSHELAEKYNYKIQEIENKPSLDF